MNQTKVTQNPHFAIDFGRVREVGGELERPPEVVRRVARHHIPLRILCKCDGGGGETLRPSDAPAISECAKFVAIFLHA